MSVKNSADKVKAAFAKQPTAPEEGMAGLITTHQCRRVKIPSLPLKVRTPFPKAVKEIGERKPSAVSADWNNEAKQTYACGFHMESSLPPGADLIPARVKRWTWKECQGVLRKIQKMKRESSSHKFDAAVLSQEDPSIQTDRSNDAIWEEAIRNKEERHFRLGRITDMHSN